MIYIILIGIILTLLSGLFIFGAVIGYYGLVVADLKSISRDRYMTAEEKIEEIDRIIKEKLKDE